MESLPLLGVEIALNIVGVVKASDGVANASENVVLSIESEVGVRAVNLSVFSVLGSWVELVVASFPIGDDTSHNKVYV